MVAVTYGAARAAAKAVNGSSLAAFGAALKGALLRGAKRFEEAQLRRAEREIALHRHLIDANTRDR